MPWASNATFLVHLGDDGRPARHLQAGPRRAPAVGLRARPAPARGRRLPAQRGDGHRRRAADRAARGRPARRGLAAVVRRRRPPRALLHDRRAATRPARPAAGASPCSTSSPTTPTARAGTACSPATGCGRIDNGLCFAPDFKLRTVIWEFAGEALTPAQVAAVDGARRVRAARGRRADLARSRSRRCSGGRRWLAEHERAARRRERRPLPLAAGVTHGVAARRGRRRCSTG